MATKPNPKLIKQYADYSVEELRYLADNEDDLETGCETNCDGCVSEHVTAINQVILLKQMHIMA